MAPGQSQVELRIARAVTGPSPRRWVDRFAVSLEGGVTVLSALQHVKETIDGTLTFRCSCRQGICGSCAVRVDGVPRLACMSLLRDCAQPGRALTIEPLAGHSVVRDLVVDLGPFFEAYRAARPWLDPSPTPPEREHRVSPEELAEAHRAHECILCGACASVCPAAAAGTAPHALLKTYQRVVDPRDASPRARLDEAARHLGLFRCHVVTDCGPVCPMGLDPADAIFRLRRLSLTASSLQRARDARPGGTRGDHG